MNKTTLLGSALAVALSAAPAMAADFHALKGLQGASPAPLQDGVLAATEGGLFCSTQGTAGSQAGFADASGVCLVSDLPPFAFFAVSNAAPVTAAVFLQVHGLVPGG
jgi:hypothetical protein